jgi:hypothetical protein
LFTKVDGAGAGTRRIASITARGDSRVLTTETTRKRDAPRAPASLARDGRGAALSSMLTRRRNWRRCDAARTEPLVLLLPFAPGPPVGATMETAPSRCSCSIRSPSARFPCWPDRPVHGEEPSRRAWLRLDEVDVDSVGGDAGEIPADRVVEAA